MLYIRHDFSNTKEYKSTDEVLKKILEVISPLRSNESSMYFYFDESELNKIRPLDRLAKNHPELEEFVVESNVKYGPSRYIGNLPGKWEHKFHAINLSQDALVEIAQGIPRRYPFHNATILIDKINLNNESIKDVEPFSQFQEINGKAYSPYPASGMARFYYPCIAIFSDSFASKRSIWFSVYIYFSEETLFELKKLPVEIDIIEEFKKHFRFLRKEVIPIRVDEEKNNSMLKKITSDNINDILSRFMAFNPENTNSTLGDSSIKEQLSEILKKNKYKIKARRKTFGEYEIIKKTNNNNFFFIELLISQSSQFIDIRLEYISYRCKYNISIPLIIDKDRNPYRPSLTPENKNEVLGNICHNLLILEEYLVIKFDNKIGKSPLWFSL